MQEARDKKRQEEEESLFQRLEESRLMLEQELGIDRFLRVYKFLQVQRCVQLFFKKGNTSLVHRSPLSVTFSV